MENQQAPNQAPESALSEQTSSNDEAQYIVPQSRPSGAGSIRKINTIYYRL